MNFLFSPSKPNVSQRKGFHQSSDFPVNCVYNIAYLETPNPRAVNCYQLVHETLILGISCANLGVTLTAILEAIGSSVKTLLFKEQHFPLSHVPPNSIILDFHWKICLQVEWMAASWQFIELRVIEDGCLL